MSAGRKKAGFLVIGLVMLAAVLSALLSQSGPPLPRAILADGRIIEVKAVTFGTNHVYGEARIKQFLRGVLPQDWLGPALPTITRPTKTCGLVAWIDVPAPTGTPPQNFHPRFGRFEVRSDDGETFDTYRRLQSKTLSQSVILPISVEVYPRRDHAFDLSSTIDGEAIKLRIPNPRPFDAIVSDAPSSIPVTNHAGDIVLREGSYTKFAWGSGPVLKFEYLRDGEDVTSEFDQWWTLTDLTGNRAWRVPTNEPIWIIELSRYRVAPKTWDPGRLHEFDLPDEALAPTNSVSVPAAVVGGVILLDIWLGGPGTVIWHEDKIARIEAPPTDGKNRPYHDSLTREGERRLEWGRAEPWALINADEFDRARYHLSVFLIDAKGRFSAGKRRSQLQWAGMDATMFSFPDLKDGQKTLAPPIKVQLVLQEIRLQQFAIDPANLPRVDAPQESE